MKHTALNILIAATLTGSALAQAQQPVQNIAQAQAVFERVDANDDGFLDLVELRAISLAPDTAGEADYNGDQRVSQREFYVAYRRHLGSQGSQVGADLEAEVTRELTRRRAAEAKKQEAEDVARKRAKGQERVEEAKQKEADEIKRKRAKGDERAEEAAKKEAEEIKRKRAKGDERLDQLEKQKAEEAARKRAEAERRRQEAKRKADQLRRERGEGRTRKVGQGDGPRRRGSDTK